MMPQEEEAQSSSASSAVATTTTVVINPEKKEKKKKGEEEERKVVKEQTNHTKCCWYLNHKHRYCTALRLSAMKSRNYGRKQEQPEPEAEQQSPSSLTSASAKSLPYDGIYCPLHTKQFELLQQQQQQSTKEGVGHDGKSGSATKEDTAVESEPVNSMSSKGVLASTAIATDERVVCPYSKGKHMVRKSKLESHLKVCPDKKAHDDSIAKPYFKLDINYGWEFAAATQAALVSSSTMPTTENLNKKAAASTFTCKKEFGDVSKLFHQPTTSTSRRGGGGTNDHEHNNDDERDDQFTYRQQFDELVDELPLPDPTTDTTPTEEEQRRDARRSLRHFKQLTNDHGLPALVRFLEDVHNNFRESGFVDVVVDHRTILNSNTTTGDGGKEEGEKKEEQNTHGDEQHSVFPTHHHSPVSYNLSEATLASFSEYCLQHREKHTTQHAALLHQILDVAGDNSSSSTATTTTTTNAMSFMELGAGKGGLAAAVKEVLPQHRIVVADQAVFRDMVDKKKQTKKMSSSSVIPASTPSTGTPASSPSIERVVVNVKDFDMRQYFLSLASSEEGKEAREEKKEERGNEAWMVLGKHLCGGCTDFALHCAVNATTTTQNASTTSSADVEGGRQPQQQSSSSVDGIVIATCCHQLCSWECFFAHRHSNSTTNNSNGTEVCPPSEGSKPPVLQVFPTRAHFECTRSISSWAIGGATVDAEKRRIGRMAKYALDAARVLALRNTGLFDSVELVEYVTEDVSGENVCIVAKKKKVQ